MTDREALIEFLKGAGFVLLMLGTFAFIVGTIGMQDEKSSEKFVVTDHYGTCAVVRYRPEGKAQDVYFLDCGNQHLEQVR